MSFAVQRAGENAVQRITFPRLEHFDPVDRLVTLRCERRSHVMS
ncbi:MAG: hypothetical protein ACAF41_14210 [Leptolyngbya sp. BL-A-14]